MKREKPSFTLILGTVTGKERGLISANRALIVGLLKSITCSSGSILFTLNLPCYAVYCSLCSMRTCTFGSTWKERRCVTVLLKRSSIIRSLRVKTFCSEFSTKPSLTTLSENYQPQKPRGAPSICLPTCPVLTAPVMRGERLVHGQGCRVHVQHGSQHVTLYM